MFRGRHEAIKAEIGRLKGLDAAVQADEERLKGYCAEILERQPMPKKGPRKLIGATSELRLVGNGGRCNPSAGRRACADSARVYRRATVVCHASGTFREHYIGSSGRTIISTFEPSNTLIRAVLAEGLRTMQRQRAVVEGIEGFSEPENPCKECGGSGHAGVPGARLEPRGAHVEVK